MTDPKKLQSAVAYLAGKLQPGKVKLFKLLYLADFTARAELGHSISTDTYENFEMGPVPVTLWRKFNEITGGCVDVEMVETGMMPEQQMRARPGFVPTLAPEERAILDRIIAQFGSWSGTRLKHHTHETIPYKATKRGDTIPYGLAGYLDYHKPTPGEVVSLLSDETLVRDLRSALASL